MGTPAKSKKAAGAGAAASAVVRGIEVTQSIQGIGNQVALVRGKQTLVRVYLEVRGLSKKQMLQGEITVAVAPNAPAQYVASMNKIAASAQPAPNLAGQRRDINASLNFLLPAPILNWGAVSIMLNRVTAPDASVTVAAHPPVTLPLIAMPPLRIKAVGLRYAWKKPDGTSVEIAPDALHFDYLHSYLQRAYPVAAVEWSQLVIDADPAFTPPFDDPLTPPGQGDQVWLAKLATAHNQLAALRASDVKQIDPRTHYYGLVSDSSGQLFFRGAAKDIPQVPNPAVVAVGPAGSPNNFSVFSWDKDRSYGDWYGAHELGHTFGRYHPGFPVGQQDASDPGFQYEDGRIDDQAHDDMIGFDVGDPALNIPMRVLVNETCHDIMTYCDELWMSSHSYNAIMDRLKLENQ